MPGSVPPASAAAGFVDTHVHVWDLSGGQFGVDYPWLTPGPLHRTFTLGDIDRVMTAMGATEAVLVQASDSLAETDELVQVAVSASRPTAVVGWLPLADAERTEAELAGRADTPLVGARHLIHDEPDREWMLRPAVARGMAVLASHGLAFDAVAERSDLLGQLPVVARRHPELTIVLDHLGKPPVALGWHSPAAQKWASLLRDVAREESVVAKISGLATVSRTGWTSADWQPFVDHALECFGAARLMLGSDWPVSTLGGDYRTVVEGTLATLADLSPTESDAIRYGNARRVYRLTRA